MIQTEDWVKKSGDMTITAFQRNNTKDILYGASYIEGYGDSPPIIHLDITPEVLEKVVWRIFGREVQEGLEGIQMQV